ncbi:hypothetical protein ABIE67_008122 [Streptomyces sp. V4I8]
MAGSFMAGQVWGSALSEGRARRPAERGNLQIVAGSLLAVGEDAAAARDLLRPMIALYLGGMGAKGKNFYNDLARAYGYEEAAGKIQDLYLSGRKREAAEAAVPDELTELVSLCGPEGYVRERIQAFRSAGVTQLNVRLVDPACPPRREGQGLALTAAQFVPAPGRCQAVRTGPARLTGPGSGRAERPTVVGLSGWVTRGFEVAAAYPLDRAQALVDGLPDRPSERAAMVLLPAASRYRRMVVRKSVPWRVSRSLSRPSCRSAWSTLRGLCCGAVGGSLRSHGTAPP